MTMIASFFRTDLRKVILIGALLSAALVLASCGLDRRADRIAFDGVYFRSKARKLDKQRALFEVAVGPAFASIQGAREAGRYEATRYCIENFGTSAVDWQNGPDAEDDALIIANDRLILRGTCAP